MEIIIFFLKIIYSLFTVWFLVYTLMANQKKDTPFEITILIVMIGLLAFSWFYMLLVDEER